MESKLGVVMKRIEVTRKGQSDQFSVTLTRANETIRCMVSVESAPSMHSDADMERAALSRAKGLAKALDASIADS